MAEPGMRLKDHTAFLKAALVYKVYILVRGTNPASLPYITDPDFCAKRLDCKAKTADNDVVIASKKRKTAGLVTDPTIVGPAAYEDRKYGKALEEWEKFRPLLATNAFDAAGKRQALYFSEGKFYGVQLDPASERYGCVMFSTMSSVPGARYIHGDYDLYAIVPAGNVTQTTLVIDEMLGQKHVRSQELIDVQNYVNRHLDRPMVLHGDQEKYSQHSDEQVYVFYPDGRTVVELYGRAAMEKFYETEFKGRKTAGKGAILDDAHGLWKVVRR
jgi:hypothetical protein